jgi:hypothetical protein
MRNISVHQSQKVISSDHKSSEDLKSPTHQNIKGTELKTIKKFSHKKNDSIIEVPSPVN